MPRRFQAFSPDGNALAGGELTEIATECGKNWAERKEFGKMIAISD